MQKIDKHIMAERLLDEVMKNPPDVKLPAGFAGRIAAKASRNFMWRQYVVEFLVYLAAITAIIAVLAGTYYYVSDDWHNWRNFLADNLSIVIGINIIGLYVLFADRVLLQYFGYRYSRRKR